MPLESNREFWNEKARENPFWYVSSFVSYDDPDLDEFWRSGRRIWSDLRSELGHAPAQGQTLVEIGCGVGRLTQAIAAEARHVHAQDISAEMLSVAKNVALPNVTFHLGDGATLEGIESGCSDLTLAYNVFQHLPSLQVLAGYLGEMRRVTKPGGLIAFTLSRRKWSDPLLPILRIKRRVREYVSKRGPSGLYTQEWLGIRPNVDEVRALSATALKYTVLHENKWLFSARLETRRVPTR
ncbi:MAG: class I SAM-dependent methyltransferase [Vicinamibacteria bacterium]